MKILFVCYGNMCRSPMCEGLARKMLGSQADVESAGTHAKRVSAAVEAIEVMRSRFGIDITSNRSRNVKDVPVDDFDYIVAMDNGVADDLRRISPSINARLISWNIDDPIGKGVEAYERSAREIQEHLEELSAYLKEKGSRKMKLHLFVKRRWWGRLGDDSRFEPTKSRRTNTTLRVRKRSANSARGRSLVKTSEIVSLEVG